jgi:hypothetical protein
MIYFKMSLLSNRIKTGLNSKISEIPSILNNSQIEFHLDPTRKHKTKFTHSQFNQVKKVKNK